MKETKKRGALRAVTAICTAAAALCVGSLAAATASAATAPVFGNITDTQGSIIIHKHEHQTTTNETAKPDGSSDISTDTIDGVTFTVYKVNDLDLLNTATDWNGLDAVKVPAVVTPNTTISINGTDHTLTKVADVTTQSGGIAKAEGLDVAAYVVVETKRPSNVVDSAQPFLVTIPFPDNANTKGWLYDVNVYPKNGVAGITKSVDSQTDLGLGATATYPVTGDVPVLADGSYLKYYIIKDNFDSRLTNHKVASVQVDGVDVNPDYYVKSPTPGTDETTVGFTKAGLAWLQTQQGKKVVVTYTATVNAVGDGTIKNTATLYTDTDTTSDPTNPNTPEPPTTPGDIPPDPSNPNPPTPPTTPDVEQKWGDLIIKKVDDGNGSAPLTGAEFKVYESADPYAASCTSKATTGDPIKVQGGTGADGATFTTGTDGKVTIPGLFVSDSVNATINAEQRCYVVVETKAPTGYVLPSGDAAKTAVAVKYGQTATSTVDTTVSNTKQAIPGLPLTGSQAMIVVVAAGVLLVGGSISLVIANRRRRA
jgi:fimbrial isopeptide formation D2 family protein/LPXTG-motif cell wall-anchored protein